MKPYMTKKEWDNWVTTTYEKALKFITENDYIVANYVLKDRATKHVYYILNANTGRVGTAKCNPTDDFIYEVGVAIAYQRYMNLPIPRIAEEIDVTEIKIGDTVVFDKMYTYCGRYKGEYCFAPMGTDTITKTVTSHMTLTFRKVVD